MARAKLRMKLDRFGPIALAVVCTIAPSLSGCALLQPSEQPGQPGEPSNQSTTTELKGEASSTEHQAKGMLVDLRNYALHKTPPPSYSPETVNINHADEAGLTTLPGITPARARQIMNNRPYLSPQDMVTKGVLTKAQFARLAGHAVAWDN